MTNSNPTLKVSARNLGPIFQLDAELTKHAQNLIFARNGTGKSFLARTLRCLERNRGEEFLSRAPNEIVSQEAIDGRGSLKLHLDETVAAQAILDRTTASTQTDSGELIFHVFSEDFVRDELRARGFDPDSEITGHIAVDRDNIELDEAEARLSETVLKRSQFGDELERQFNREKNEKLSKGAGVNKGLREFKNVTLEHLRVGDKPDPPSPTFAQLLSDLETVRGIPDSPRYPAEASWNEFGVFDATALNESLGRTTSLSTIAEDIKSKIEKEPEFYRIGTALFQIEDNTCPFCEQDLQTERAKGLIDSLLRYFNDEEESHKQELRLLQSKIQKLQQSLSMLRNSAENQVAEFDSLKTFLPSKRGEIIEAPINFITTMQAELSGALKQIEEKFTRLDEPLHWDSSKYESEQELLVNALQRNNVAVQSLNEAIRLSDAERQNLHRRLCVVFGKQFAIDNWQKLESLRILSIDEKKQAAEIARLQRSMPATDAKTRVAETFELLLGAVFTGKYKFDRERFVLTLSDKALPRQTDKTLSDGEKTAIAFCYFVASIHKCVEADFEYERLFLVLDDPVASMSYDFIFSIAQILKNLSISKTGEVSLNPAEIDGQDTSRPRLLILTHSSYFFNVLYTNRVIKTNAAFSISADGEIHTAKKLQTFVAPFQEQLRHIKAVADGSPPDFGTANCVRSVLEAVGRFCRPDKANTLSNFIIHLAGEEGIKIKSVIINALSHGSFFEEIPPPEDLTLACQEAIIVIQRYAPGQLEAL
ncbi:AAA family ATPase [Altererythrobacter sp. MF3-039]|uniref:AAA family ATPase n=1 Tax=Altererythrobacter sp. MF3-039 TaxID=3252901 RepID=UPI00390C7D6A